MAGGTDNDDILGGTSSDDSICGLAGNDLIQGLGGDDIIYGGKDDDSITGGLGKDTLFGDSGNDTIVGGADGDLIYGGDDDDLIRQINDASDNTVFGGDGTDHLDLSGSTLSWNIDSSGAGGSGTATIQFFEIETITGTAFSDVITGSNDVDRINGGDGDDTLEGTGFSGNVDLRGGDGNDRLVASSRADQLRGDDGNDTFLYDDTTDSSFLDNIFGGSGVDRLLIQGQADGDYFDLDLIDVQSIEEIEFDTIGSNMDVTLELNEGEFTVTGEEFANNLLIDGYNSSGSTEVIYIKVDNEHFLDFSGWTFQTWDLQGEHVSIEGSSTADTIIGTIDSDAIDAGGGNDVVTDVNGGSLITLIGGSGDDELDLSGSTMGWAIDQVAGTATSGSTSGQISEFETITATDFNDDILGDSILDRINGGDGDDTLEGSGFSGNVDLRGGDGNDTLVASSRADQLRGDDGNDTFLYDDTTDSSFLDNIFGGSGVDKLLIQGQADGDYFDLDLIDVQSIEEIEFDTIGSNMDVTLELNEGEFTVTGEEFANNLLIDGYNSSGSTEVIYIKVDNEHFLDFSGWTFQTWGLQGEHVSIEGSSTADTIIGTIDSDAIDAGGGNDVVTDVNGGSLITLIGGSGDDELDLSGSTLGWVIDQVAGTATSGSTSGQISEFETITATDFNDDILGDSILDRINGGDGDDTLEGSGFSGNVDLRGGDGNDTLVASSRADQLRGDDGNDTFLYDDTTDSSFLDNIFGGSGVDRLLIQGQADGDYFDLDLIDVQSIEEIEFDTIGSNMDVTLELNEGEFTVTGEEFANNLLIDGYNSSGSTEVIYIKVDNEHFLDFSGWTFQTSYCQIWCLRCCGSCGDLVLV